MDFVLNSGVSLAFFWLSFLRYSLHLIFVKTETSLHKSASLIEGCLGENPDFFSNKVISDGDNDPLILSFTNLMLALAFPYNVSRVSESNRSP